jgi:hypothetical protein
MPLQDQIFPVDFSGGINTKTDSKKVVPGEFLLVQDGVYTKIDNIQKRNGYTALTSAIAGGGNLVAPRMIDTYGTELTCQDSGQFYSYSPSLPAWEKQGNYTSIDFSEKGIFYQTSVSGAADCAVVGNYTVYVYEDARATGVSPAVYTTIVDNVSGVEILPNTLVAPYGGNGTTDTSAPRVINLSPTKAGIFYLAQNGGTASAIAMKVVTISGTTATIGTQVIVQPNANLPSLPSHPSFDVSATSTGCVLTSHVFSSPDTVTTRTLDDTGATINSAAISLSTSSTVTNPVANIVDPTNGNIWVYYADTISTTHSIYYEVYDSNLTPILTSTIITSEGQNAILNIVAQSTNSTTQSVFYTVVTQDTNGNSINSIHTAIPTISGGITGIALYLLGVGVMSRVFSFNGAYYFIAYYNGPTYDSSVSSTTVPNVQPTYFIIDTANACVAGRFASGLALAITTWFTPHVATVSSGNYVFCATKQFASSVTFTNNSTFTQNTVSSYGSVAFSFGFNTLRTYKNTQAGELNILNGALLSAYDGQTCAEWGYHLYPEIYKIAQSTPMGGVIPAGTYAYVAVYQWLDANGNLHQSAPSQEVSITVASANSEVSITVTDPFLTGKTGVTIQLYRTIASGTEFFQINSGVGNFSNTVFSQVFIDNTTDSQLRNAPPLYTNGGVSENSTPPPSLVLEPRFNRLWCVDAEAPNTLWYSKQFAPGYGLSPANFNITQIQPTQGNTVGLKAMDDKMIVFKDQGILWFAGDGANDTGNNSTLTQPQTIPSGSGLAVLGSLTLVPAGIIYQTTKGIFLLDRGLNPHYSDQVFNGAAVETYSTTPIQDSKIIPNTTQVRFLCASGVSLHYDYMFNKWSVFTNHLGYSSDNWNGAYVYVRTDGAIYQENSSTYLDNATPFALTVKTSWLAIAGIQGFERLRHLLVVGDGTVNGSHGVQISTAVNFIETYTAHNPFTFVQTPFQFRQFLTIQKCDSMSLLIQEVVTGASGEFMDLTNLSFNCGIKKGLHKVRSAVSVG